MFAKIKSILMILVLMFAFVPVTFAAAGINATDDGSLEEVGVDEDLENSTTDDVINETVVDNNETIIDDNNETIVDNNNETTVEDDSVVEDEDETEDDEVEVITDEEADILSSQVGAQMRMLQLQKRVEAQAESGQIIVDRINEVSPDFDTSRLEEIVDEFYVLVELIEEYDYEQDKSVLVDDFVGMKKEAIDLTKEFKTIAKDSLSENDKKQLREKVEEKKREWQEKKDAKLEQFKKQYNLKKVEELALRMGYDVEEAKERLKNGEITIDDVKKKLVSDYQKMSAEDKAKIQAELKEARIKNNIQVKERKEEFKAEAEERREELKQRVEERKEELKVKAEERRKELKQKVEERRGESEQEDEEIENELEIEIEIESDAKVKIEQNGDKQEYVLDTVVLDDVLADVASKLDMSVEEVEDIAEIEVKVESEDDESEEDDESDVNETVQ